METITSEDMAIADENSEYLGVKRVLLMENAGRSIADFVKDMYKDVSGKKIIIFCGTGNNGGDGMVAARHLAGYGAKVSVILVGSPEKIRTEEASTNWRIIQNMRKSIDIVVAKELKDLDNVAELVKDCDLIIDGIFGTGVKGAIRDPWLTAIRMINRSGKYVIAIDIPSGMDPDTGSIAGEVVKADVTITFHKAKPALLMEQCKEYVGKIVLAPIGMPPESELIAGPGDLRASFSYIGKDGGILGIALDWKQDLLEIVVDISSMLCKEVLLVDAHATTSTRENVKHVSMDELINSVQLLNAILIDGSRGKDVVDKALLRKDLFKDVKFITRSHTLASPLSGYFSTVQIATYEDIVNICKLDLDSFKDLKLLQSLARTIWKILKGPFLIMADTDLMFDGKVIKANWMHTPVISEELVALYVSIASSLLAWRISDIRSLASTSFLARSVFSTISNRKKRIEPREISSTVLEILDKLNLLSMIKH